MRRDTENVLKLQSMGYTVVRFWENQVRKDLDGCVLTITAVLD